MIRTDGPGAVLGIKARDSTDIIDALETGLAYKSLTFLQQATGFSLEMLADWTGISLRTLHRRSSEGRFRVDESERIYRAANIFHLALRLFEGDQDAARHWLTTPQSALHHKSPLQFSQTELGARQVEDLIGRLQYGVFS